MNKKTLIGAVIVVAVAVILGFAFYSLSRQTSGRGGTSNADAISLDSSLTVGTTASITGTTTIGTLPATFSLNGTYKMSTGTPTTLFTNSKFDSMYCSSASGQVYATTTTAGIASNNFAPSIVVSLGTSTSATGYSTTLLASTTIATTTPTVLTTVSSRFLLRNGESLVGTLSDFNTTGASSTYYGNWAIKANGIFCSVSN